MSYAQWAKHGGSPLWLRFSQNAWGRADTLREAFRPLATFDPTRVSTDDEDGAVRVALRVPAGAEQRDVVKHVVAQLRELDAIMAAAGMPLLSAETPAEGS